MDYSSQDLDREIADKIDALMTDGKVVDARWVAHAICSDHAAGLADNADGRFWRHCGYRASRDAVRRHISKRTDPTIEEKQFILPGFDHVRCYYPVPRDGEVVMVAAFDLTDDEIDTKVEELAKNQQTLRDHANELMRFKAWRRTLANQAAE